MPSETIADLEANVPVAIKLVEEGMTLFAEEDIGADLIHPLVAGLVVGDRPQMDVLVRGRVLREERQCQALIHQQLPPAQTRDMAGLVARMDDGTEFEGRASEVCLIAPGHDAWVVGDEPVVGIDFQGVSTYAGPTP